MATRGTIALEYADGTVDQIYSHWDNYLSHNGKILLEHYKDPFKVQQLMDLGDLSSLGVGIGEHHDFDDRSDDCTFYGRDRGESGVGSRRFENYADYLKNAQSEEYNYILRKDGVWYVEFYGRKGTVAECLAEEMIEAEVAEDE